MNKYRLQDISGVYGGGTPDTKNTSYWNGSIPWITPKDMSLDNSLFIDSGERYITEDGVAKSSAKLLPKGSVIFSSRAPIGYCSIAERPLTTSQGCKGIICNENLIDNVYLCYVLKMAKHQLNAMSVGSTFREISTNELKDVVIHIPNIDRQRAISTLLVSIERNINICDQFRVYLKKIIRLIYDYWFVQFDFPDENGRPYKSSGGKMVYNDQLKREIPEGWNVESLTNTDLCSVIKPGINKFDGKKLYLATAEVQGDEINTNPPLIDYASRETRANMQPSPYSVWFAKMKDSIKHIYMSHASQDLIDNYVLSTGFAGLQANEESFAYLSAYTMQSTFEATKNLLAHGATQKAVNNNDLSDFLIIVPSDSILERFSEIANPMFELIDNNRQQSQQLAHLRDWLLPMLMNGQVRIN